MPTLSLQSVRKGRMGDTHMIRAINDRNQLSHVYRQEMAESIRLRLPEYVSMVDGIVGVLQKKSHD